MNSKPPKEEIQIIYTLRRDFRRVGWEMADSGILSGLDFKSSPLFPLVRHVGRYLLKLLNRISHDN
ncbi:MAG: hypothetical protein HC880_16425 [Bacteroidia bacterium]|nr:hypothetical protein [Bacteroidia bacterium]